MKIAIQKAEKLGLGSVAIFNCNHIGFLADYSMMALKHNMIGVTAANSSGNRVVPFGGRSGVIDTNPICFAIPTGNENPIVLDMATSVVANGKIRVAYARGKKVPEGWIIDAEGNPTTDPADWVGPPIGSTLPLGGVVGYKGFGLGIVMDVLGGALTGFGCGKEFASKYGEGRSMNGVFMLAIKISAYTDLDDFRGHVDRLISSIRDSPRAPGANEILLPGEPELRSTKKRLREGIYVEEDTWNKISGLAKNLGINLKDI